MKRNAHPIVFVVVPLIRHVCMCLHTNQPTNQPTSVRYEAATTLAALLRAMPFLGGPLLHRACLELEDIHAKLVDLAIHPSRPPSALSPAHQLDGDPRARAMAAASAKADAEKKKKAMFSLHGRATVSGCRCVSVQTCVALLKAVAILGMMAGGGAIMPYFHLLSSFHLTTLRSHHCAV